MKQQTEAPRCPIHHCQMHLLPALPNLKPVRGITALDLKLRRELNAWKRYRCRVAGCCQVAAIAIESAA